ETLANAARCNRLDPSRVRRLCSGERYSDFCGSSTGRFVRRGLFCASSHFACDSARHPFAGGHGTPHWAHCALVHPPWGVFAASISSGLGNSFVISTIFCTVPPFVLTLYRPGPALKRWGLRRGKTTPRP